MNKFIIAVIVVVVVAGIIIAFRNFSGTPEKSVSPSVTPQPSIAPQPSGQATSTPTSTLFAPQGALDRIEAAIRAKLRR